MSVSMALDIFLQKKVTILKPSVRPCEGVIWRESYNEAIAAAVEKGREELNQKRRDQGDG